jgi:hypothetical protein
MALDHLAPRPGAPDPRPFAVRKAPSSEFGISVQGDNKGSEKSYPAPRSPSSDSSSTPWIASTHRGPRLPPDAHEAARGRRGRRPKPTGNRRTHPRGREHTGPPPSGPRSRRPGAGTAAQRLGTSTWDSSHLLGPEPRSASTTPTAPADPASATILPTASAAASDEAALRRVLGATAEQTAPTARPRPAGGVKEVRRGWVYGCRSRTAARRCSRGESPGPPIRSGGDAWLRRRTSPPAR